MHQNKNFSFKTSFLVIIKTSGDKKKNILKDNFSEAINLDFLPFKH